jgi:hypothetical protein
MQRLIRRPAQFDIKRGIHADKFPLAKAFINHKRQFKIIKRSNNKGISSLSNFVLYA